MPHRPNKPESRPESRPEASPHLTDAELLAFVELGASGIDDQSRARLAVAIAADPPLGVLLAGMRVDRAALRSLANERLPSTSGLLDAVEASLQREALAKLATAGEPVGRIPVSAIPVSTIRVHRPGVIGRVGARVGPLVQRRGVRQLAMAAGLALALSVAYLGVRSTLDSGELRLVSNSGTAGTNSDSGQGNTSGTTLADATSSGDGGQDSLTTTIAEADVAGELDAAGGEVGDTDQSAGALTSIELAALAREQRLVLVVTVDPEVDLRRELAAWSRSAELVIGGQRLATVEAVEREERPNEFTALAALVPAGAPAMLPSADPRSPFPFVASASDPASSGSNALSGPPAPWPAFTPAAGGGEPRILLTKLDSGEERLPMLLPKLIEQLRAGSGGAAEARTVRLVVLERAALPPAQPTADELLWWTLPPSRWLEPAVVPVIIEPDR